MEDFVIIGPRATLCDRWTVFCEYMDEEGRLGVEAVASTSDRDTALFMLNTLRSTMQMPDKRIIDFFLDRDVILRNSEVNDAFFESRGLDDLPFKKSVYDYEVSMGRIASAYVEVKK